MKASCTHPDLDSIVAFLAPLQIYKPAGPTAYTPDKYIDCIDIAVKLALRVNNSTLSSIVTPDHIKVHSVVVAISNMEDLDKAFGGVEQPVRVKQVSDPSVAKGFKTLQDAYFKI